MQTKSSDPTKMTPPIRQSTSTRQPAAAPPKPAPRARPWLRPTLLAIVVIASLATAGKFLLGTSSAPVPIGPASQLPDVTKQETPAVAPPPNPATPPKPVAEERAIVDDDGKSLWVSPTNGKPLDLAYLSPGAQIILA